MGGIATSHLAQYVDMCIIDRSFASLDQVVARKFFGLSGVALYSLATLGWDSRNDTNFAENGLLDSSDRLRLIKDKGFAVKD